MSVLIKGMEMPKSCVSCRWYKRLGCELEDLVTNTVQGCPLTEVPTPHGDLIDKTELLYAQFAKVYRLDPIVSDGIKKTDKEVYAYQLGWNEALTEAYLNATIIVSAEGKEK